MNNILSKNCDGLAFKVANIIPPINPIDANFLALNDAELSLERVSSPPKPSEPVLFFVIQTLIGWKHAEIPIAAPKPSKALPLPNFFNDETKPSTFETPPVSFKALVIL